MGERSNWGRKLMQGKTLPMELVWSKRIEELFRQNVEALLE